MPDLRRRLARALCPEVFADAHRGLYVERLVSELRWYCSESPDILAACTWVLASADSRTRAKGGPPPPGTETIAGFRERLRAARRASATLPG